MKSRYLFIRSNFESCGMEDGMGREGGEIMAKM